MAGSGDAVLRSDSAPLLSVRNLVVEYKVAGRGRVHAVSDVSFDVLRGEALGLVGESGCGKSTLGLSIMRLTQVLSGRIELDGQNLLELRGESLRSRRPSLQMVFQDPLGSLNSRRKVRDIVAEPLRIWNPAPSADWPAKVDTMLEAVGLDPAQVGSRTPRRLSGGQAQRISLARALIMDPMLLVCDEPVASLDVSIQAQILNLLHDMKERFELTLIFISHDLSVVKNISDRLAVMYLGKLCEVGSADSIYARPRHPYTRALLDSVPTLELRLPVATVRGDVPSPRNPPSGCRFRTRCPRATELCAEREPVMVGDGGDHYFACHHPLPPPATLPASAHDLETATTVALPASFHRRP